MPAHTHVVGIPTFTSRSLYKHVVSGSVAKDHTVMYSELRLFASDVHVIV